MKKENFSESNMNYKDGGRCLVFDSGDKKVVITKWSTTIKERLKILFGNEIWMVIGSDGTSTITLDKPFEEG